MTTNREGLLQSYSPQIPVSSGCCDTLLYPDQYLLDLIYRAVLQLYILRGSLQQRRPSFQLYIRSWILFRVQWRQDQTGGRGACLRAIAVGMCATMVASISIVCVGICGWYVPRGARWHRRGGSARMRGWLSIGCGGRRQSWAVAWKPEAAAATKPTGTVCALECRGSGGEEEQVTGLRWGWDRMCGCLGERGKIFSRGSREVITGGDRGGFSRRTMF
jgi:hypothetical protein